MFIYQCLTMGKRVNVIDLEGSNRLGRLELFDFNAIAEAGPFVGDLVDEMTRILVTGYSHYSIC